LDKIEKVHSQGERTRKQQFKPKCQKPVGKKKQTRLKWVEGFKLDCEKRKMCRRICLRELSSA